MVKPFRSFVCAGLVIIGCNAASRPIGTLSDTSNLSSPGKSYKADGKPLSIRLTSGRRVTLVGFKIDAKAGLSLGQCGVKIDRQRIVTMGADETGAYTCGALAAAGILPPDGQTQRIGLIYDVSSPNASFRTAVVLRLGSAGWQIDPNYIGRFDDSRAGRSIPALRRAVR